MVWQPIFKRASEIGVKVPFWPWISKDWGNIARTDWPNSLFLHLWISLKMTMFGQPGSTLYCVLGSNNKMRLLQNFRTLCEPMPSLKAAKVVSRINSPTEITNNQQNKRNKNPRKMQIYKQENTVCTFVILCMLFKVKYILVNCRYRTHFTVFRWVP